MNEREYHSPIGQLPIEAGDHDQIDKSLRCKINSEWEEREKEVEKKDPTGKTVCKQDCNRCQISRRCEN